MFRSSIAIFLAATILMLTACRSDTAAGPGDPAISPTAPARLPVVSPTAIATEATATPLPTPAPTPPPRPIVFPDDERSHDNQIEWWYYNGHLTSSNGELFGFHYVIFQARRPGWPPLLASQLGVTNLTAGDHVEGEAVLLTEKATTDDHVLLSGGDWELRINDEGHSLKGAIGETSIALELAPQRPPTLHNDIGWLSDEAGWTYYYSWTRMSATGTIRVDETVSEVDGSAWMDHQWGDFDVARYPAGWQWFAVQFDDGSDLMLTASRDETLMPIALYGTFVHPDGTTVSLTEAEHLIEIEETDMWTSPHTGGEYPVGWKVTIDALDLELNMTALVADQEIASAQFIPIKYWEGKVSVSGTRNGDVISGDAYAELTGYAPN